MKKKKNSLKWLTYIGILFILIGIISLFLSNDVVEAAIIFPLCIGIGGVCLFLVMTIKKFKEKQENELH